MKRDQRPDSLRSQTLFLYLNRDLNIRAWYNKPFIKMTNSHFLFNFNIERE